MAEMFQFISSVLFFIIYYYCDIYVASLALSVMSAIHIAAGRLLNFNKTSLSETSLLMLSLFGFATWYFSNPRFIQWKITVINLVFAIGLYLYRHINGIAFFTHAFQSSQINIPNPVGLRADNLLITFFACVAFINYFVFTHYSESTWVYFKTSLIFVNTLYLVMISVYINKFAKHS